MHAGEVVHGRDQFVDLRALGRRQHQFGTAEARHDGLGQGAEVEVGPRGGEQLGGAGRPTQGGEFGGDPGDGRALVAEAPRQFGQQRLQFAVRQVLAPAGEPLGMVRRRHLQCRQGLTKSAQGAALMGADEQEQRQAGQRRGVQASVVGCGVGQEPGRQVERAAAQPAGAERLGQVFAGQGGAGLQRLHTG
ncbi:hypothetical protein D9M68_519630 [compost metagenome]